MSADLSAESLLEAYACGAFPMADPQTGEVNYFTCDPRCLIPLDERFRVTSSLKRVVRSERYEIRVNTSFAKVIRACAAVPRPEGATWIGASMIPAFEHLHEIGFAHSIEAWRDDELVGGSYGVAIGAAFFGESMFCDTKRGRDASKVRLVHLVERLRKRGFYFLDSQYGNPHIYSFGAYDIDAEDYSELLEEAIKEPQRW